MQYRADRTDYADQSFSLLSVLKDKEIFQLEKILTFENNVLNVKITNTSNDTINHKSMTTIVFDVPIQTKT